MAVPYTFGTATASIPLSQLDSNFATVITLGNTAIQLGNTVTTLNNMTLANVTISSGNITLTNVSATTANVTTANVVTMIITGNETVQGNTTVTGTITGAKLIPTGSSVTGNGMYLPATNSVGISTNGTNAVYIDASQNVGIGTSSPGAKLDVRGYGGGLALRLSRDPATDILDFYQGGGVSYIDASLAGTSLAFATGGTSRMRLDSSGNLGLGVTPSAWQSGWKVFEIENAGNAIANDAATSLRLTSNARFAGSTWIYASTNVAATYAINGGAHVWNTAPSGTAGNAISFTQAMTLDASGNLLVGQTSSGAVNSNSWSFTQSAAGQLVGNHASGSASGSIYIGFYYNTTGIGSITQSGTTAVLYNVTSDQRLKENIVDAPEFGSVIDAIQVRSYDWKADGNHQRAGFVAQELATVAPEAVHQPADPEEMMAVDYSKLVPMLVKEIQSLRKRLAALESR